MKSICLLGASVLVLFAASCNEKPQETKTVIIEREVEKSIPKPEEKKTTIKVSPDGGTVKTKEVEVEVNK